jgi:hypothetical protein
VLPVDSPSHGRGVGSGTPGLGSFPLLGGGQQARFTRNFLLIRL